MEAVQLNRWGGMKSEVAEKERYTVGSRDCRFISVQIAVRNLLTERAFMHGASHTHTHTPCSN